MGVDTLAAMGEQRDKLQDARDHVRKIESEAALASRQLRVFAKRMVMDKIILGVLVVIFLAVLVVIIIVAAKPAAKAVTEKFQ
jgi:cell division protein FtsL